MNRLFILGAADPEMAAIEKLLLACGERVAYASIGVDRCHPGNAYRFTSPCGAGVDYDKVILVECDHTDAGHGFVLPRTQVIRIDHHRPGDPGYGQPPSEFLPASSIGQVWVLLHPDHFTPWYHPTAGWITSDGGTVEDVGGNVVGEPYARGVPEPIVMCAAADHCLEHAYRGRCPGVDPDALMRWRAESRAAFQGRTVDAVLADVETARQRLQDAIMQWIPCSYCGESGAYCCCETAGTYRTWDAAFADLRGESIPELPEAAAREGIPFIATVTDRDGRVKTVLQSAPPELVRRFLAGEIVPGLVDYYGDPARGFAGGYSPLP